MLSETKLRIAVLSALRAKDRIKEQPWRIE